MLLGAMLTVIILAKSVHIIKAYQRGFKKHENLMLNLQVVMYALMSFSYFQLFIVELAVEFREKSPADWAFSGMFVGSLILFTFLQGVSMLLCLYSFNAFAVQPELSTQVTPQLNESVQSHVKEQEDPIHNQTDQHISYQLIIEEEKDDLFNSFISVESDLNEEERKLQRNVLKNLITGQQYRPRKSTVD